MLPVLNINKCTKCNLCYKNCTANAIENETIIFNENRCILCGHCAVICPTEAITINGKVGESTDKLPENIADHINTLIRSRRSIRHFKERQARWPLDPP